MHARTIAVGVSDRGEAIPGVIGIGLEPVIGQVAVFVVGEGLAGIVAAIDGEAVDGFGDIEGAGAGVVALDRQVIDAGFVPVAGPKADLATCDTYRVVEVRG